MTKLFNWLRVIFTPSCWLQNRPYSAKWDRELQGLMSTHKFIRRNEFEAFIGDVVVWVENHPYASFHQCGKNRVRPSRTTILKAMDKLMRDYSIQENQND